MKNRLVRAVGKILVAFLLAVFSIHNAKSQEKEPRKLWLNVTVTDKDGKYAERLKAENFELAVDKKTQKITDFVERDEPASVVFLIDLSGSMKRGDKVKVYGGGAETFVQNANRDNEYSVIAFNTQPQLVLDAARNVKSIEDSLAQSLKTPPQGNTAFYDALYAAVQKLASGGSYRKKVLIVCSDGLDNVSRLHGFGDVKSLLKEESILFYAVSLRGNFAFDVSGAAVLDDLAALSGGKSFYPRNAVENSEVFNLIARELANQYLIGFEFSGDAEPKKILDVKIKINAEDKTRLTARTKSGFYLPTTK